MKVLSSSIVLTSAFLFVLQSMIAPSAFAKTQKRVQSRKKAVSEDLMKRIDFGNSYIMGQSIKSGAVYLLQRKKSEIKSMLNYRENYRKEILESFNVREEKTNAVK